MPQGGKIIRDAVHGDMAFDREELEIVDTAGMQRLRGVRQLGTAHLVYPSAVHTRFEHALGACTLAGRILDTVESASGKRFSSEERRLTRIAALLHDITHAPFSHTFEDERRIAPRHDRDSSRLDCMLDQGVGDALHRRGRLDAVRKLLLKSEDASSEPIAYEIFAGTVGADLLDYVRRDAFHCGLAQNYDDRVFSLFTRIGGRLALDLRRGGLFRHDALSELIHLLRLRYALTERVYYHHAKVASGAMLSKALEMALDAGVFAYDELYALRDDAFLHVLRQRAAKLPHVLRPLDDLERRNLYKPAYLLTNDGFHAVRPSVEIARELERRYHFNAENARTRLENDLCDAAGAPPGSVIVYCPAADMALKEARVQVRIDEATTRSLDALHHPEVDVLLEKHRRLWRLTVLVSSAVTDRRAVAEMCEARFGVPNMLPAQRKGRLTFAGGCDDGDEKEPGDTEAAPGEAFEKDANY
jgi:HD superfamily phosphohydrolase